MQREAAERQVFDQILALQAAAHGAQGVAARRFFVAVGSQDQQWVIGGAARQEFQQGDGGLARPMQVFEQQQQWTRLGQPGQAGGGRIEQAGALTIGLQCRQGGQAAACPQIGKQRSQGGQVRRCALQGRQQGQGGVQRLDHGLVGARLAGSGASIQHPPALLFNQQRQLAPQARLAHPCLAADQHQPA